MEASALWIMGLPWGSWEGGWAQRRMSYLGEQEAKKLDRKGVWGTDVYVGHLKAGSFYKETQKGTLLPISLFHSQS